MNSFVYIINGSRVARQAKKEVSRRNLGQLLPVFAYTKCTARTHSHTHTLTRLHTQTPSPHTGGHIIEPSPATEVACMIGYYGLVNMRNTYILQ